MLRIFPFKADFDHPFTGSTSIKSYLATLKGNLVLETKEAFVAWEGDWLYVRNNYLADGKTETNPAIISGYGKDKQTAPWKLYWIFKRPDLLQNTRYDLCFCQFYFTAH